MARNVRTARRSGSEGDRQHRVFSHQAVKCQVRVRRVRDANMITAGQISSMPQVYARLCACAHTAVACVGYWHIFRKSAAAQRGSPAHCQRLQKQRPCDHQSIKRRDVSPAYAANPRPATPTPSRPGGPGAAPPSRLFEGVLYEHQYKKYEFECRVQMKTNEYW